MNKLFEACYSAFLNIIQKLSLTEDIKEAYYQALTIPYNNIKLTLISKCIYTKLEIAILLSLVLNLPRIFYLQIVLNIL